MDEPKVAVLRHYASPYYDPQKAHEYYMRTHSLNEYMIAWLRLVMVLEK